MKWKTKIYIEENNILFSDLDYLFKFYYKPEAVKVLLYYRMPELLKYAKADLPFVYRFSNVDKYIVEKPNLWRDLSVNTPFIEFFLSKSYPGRTRLNMQSVVPNNTIIVVKVRSPYFDKLAQRHLGLET